jgi:hypothetical protein
MLFGVSPSSGAASAIDVDATSSIESVDATTAIRRRRGRIIPLDCIHPYLRSFPLLSMRDFADVFRPDGGVTQWVIRINCRRIDRGLGKAEYSGDGQPGRLSEREAGVGVALGVGVAEEEGGVSGSEQPGSVDSVDDPPVSGDESVARVSEEELVVRHSGGEGVAVVDEPGAFSMQSDFVYPVSVEVPDEGLVSGITEEEGELGRTETSIVGA